MRIALVGVLLIGLTGCGAIVRALNGQPDPDKAAIDAFQNQVHCPERPDSTENIERGGNSYLRVRGCGEERDCRFVDTRRVRCVLTPEQEERQAAEELARINRETAADKAADEARRQAAAEREAEIRAAEVARRRGMALAALSNQRKCNDAKAVSEVVVEDAAIFQVEACGDIFECIVGRVEAVCDWPRDVDAAKKRLELEIGCDRAKMIPRRSQRLFKEIADKPIETYVAYRIDACGRAYVCTVDAHRADCKAALDSTGK